MATDLTEVTDQELWNEAQRRERARREAKQREEVLAAEMRRSARRQRDEEWAARYGLTIKQYDELAVHVLEEHEQDQEFGL
jgi:hypothetical protein